MGIVGGNPESGVRLELERPTSGGPPWVYDGDAVTPAARHRMRATVDAAGAVAIELAADAPPDLAERARLIVRAAFKHAKEADDSAAPPRRIVRWRADR
jgi:hypothetical protein